SLSACTGNLSDAVSIMKVPGNLPSGMWPQQRQSIATLDSKIITAWDTYLNPVPAGAGPYWPKVDTRLTFVDAATGQRTRPDVVFNTNPLVAAVESPLVLTPGGFAFEASGNDADSTHSAHISMVEMDSAGNILQQKVIGGGSLLSSGTPWIN